MGTFLFSINKAFKLLHYACYKCCKEILAHCLWIHMTLSYQQHLHVNFELKYPTYLFQRCICKLFWILDLPSNLRILFEKKASIWVQKIWLWVNKWRIYPGYFYIQISYNIIPVIHYWYFFLIVKENDGLSSDISQVSWEDTQVIWYTSNLIHKWSDAHTFNWRSDNK